MPELKLDLGLLESLLIQVINGGGAGWVAFLIWNKVEEYIPKLQGWHTDAKRSVVFGMCAAFALGSYFLLGWLAVVTLPGSPQEWVTTLFSVMMTAFFSSQIIHGRAKAATE